MTETLEKPRRGRPRDASVDAAILKAAWEVLAESGYIAFSLDAVAQRADCTRPAIYRRYRDKRELVLAAIHAMTHAFKPKLDPSASPRDALIGHLSGWINFLNTGGSEITLVLAHARRKDKSLSSDLDDLFRVGRRFYFDALRRACPKSLDDHRCGLLVDGLIGSVFFRRAMIGGVVTRQDLAFLVDQTIAAARKPA